MSFDLKSYLLLKQVGGTSGAVGGQQIQADWNAAEGEAGYVKNRTHWVEENNVTIVENLTVDLNVEPNFPSWYEGELTNGRIMEAGQPVTLVWDGVIYDNLLCNGDSEEAWVVIESEDTDDYIVVDMGVFDGGVYLYIETSSTISNHTLSIYSKANIYHHINHKYIKDMYYDERTEVLRSNIWNVSFNQKLDSTYYASIDESNCSPSVLEWLENATEPTSFKHATVTVNGKTKVVESVASDVFNSKDKYLDFAADRAVFFAIHYYFGDPNDYVPYGYSIRFNESALSRYFGVNSLSDVTDISFVIYEGDFATLDEKFIPDSIVRIDDCNARIDARIDDCITYVDNHSMSKEKLTDTKTLVVNALDNDITQMDHWRYAKSSDIVIPYESFVGATCSTLYSGGTTNTSLQWVERGTNCYGAVGWYIVIEKAGECSLDIYNSNTGKFMHTAVFTAPSAGIYLWYNGPTNRCLKAEITYKYDVTATRFSYGDKEYSFSINENGDYVITDINSGEIVNTSSDIILRSSTDGSNKKFRITVSDDGTLSATEI